MGILDELSSATGDKASNQDLVDRCLKTPALLHSVAEGLRTGNPKAKLDCAQIMVDVAKRWPDIVGPFVTDFIDASKSKNKRVAKLGFTGLTYVISSNPAEVFAERDYFLGLCKNGDPLAFSSAAVLAALCGHNSNYRGKLLGGLLRMLNNVKDKDITKWCKAILAAVEGSADSVKRLTVSLEPRFEALSSNDVKTIKKCLAKAERKTIKKPCK